MSSAPVGLDVKEYVYGYFPYIPQGPGFFQISAANGWLVTRVQFFGGPNGGQIALDPGPAIVVAPEGCMTFEPNGAHRSEISVLGEQSLVVIEYWFQARAGQFAQGIAITVSP